MKSFFSTVVVLSVTLTSLIAQTPQGISYQAIAFHSDGTPVVNGNVGAKVSILDNSVNGTVVYSETHTKTTNAQGLFNFNIGQGSPVAGIFSTIDWASNSKFLKVEIDPAGGSNYTVTGTNQLMSVPYALYSENTNVDNITSSSNLSSVENGTMLVVYTSSTAYGFCRSSSGAPNWYSQSLSGTPVGAIATDSSIVIYTSSTIYGFMRSSSGAPNWYSQPLSGTPTGAITNGKNCVVVYTTSNAYGFTTSSSGSPNWYSQSLSGPPIGGSSAGDLIVIYAAASAYGFTRSSSGAPNWYSQPLSGTPIEIIPK